MQYNFMLGLTVFTLLHIDIAVINMLKQYDNLANRYVV